MNSFLATSLMYGIAFYNLVVVNLKIHQKINRNFIDIIA